jgi:hypothetical protein
MWPISDCYFNNFARLIPIAVSDAQQWVMLSPPFDSELVSCSVPEQYDFGAFHLRPMLRILKDTAPRGLGSSLTAVFTGWGTHESDFAHQYQLLRFRWSARNQAEQ